MWNSAGIIRREQAEDEFTRQLNEMTDLLKHHITKDLVHEWLLDICDEVARCRDIGNPTEHVDIAYLVLSKVMHDSALEFLKDSSIDSVSH